MKLAVTSTRVFSHSTQLIKSKQQIQFGIDQLAFYAVFKMSDYVYLAEVYFMLFHASPG